MPVTTVIVSTSQAATRLRIRRVLVLKFRRHCEGRWKKEQAQGLSPTSESWKEQEPQKAYRPYKYTVLVLCLI